MLKEMGYEVTVTAPERSLAQRREALAKANRVRTARAEWKRAMKVRRVDVLLPLLESAEARETVWDSMKVLDYLLAVPKVGRVKATKCLSRAQISPSKTLGGMSPRQRTELLVIVGPYVPRGRIVR